MEVSALSPLKQLKSCQACVNLFSLCFTWLPSCLRFRSFSVVHIAASTSGLTELIIAEWSSLDLAAVRNVLGGKG